MKLTDIFWKEYELDMQEVKISYLNWAINHAREPVVRFRHLFLWDHQKEFCIVNSRYGRAFAISPFGMGVRGVPKTSKANVTYVRFKISKINLICHLFLSCRVLWGDRSPFEVQTG